MSAAERAGARGAAVAGVVLLAACAPGAATSDLEGGVVPGVEDLASARAHRDFAHDLTPPPSVSIKGTAVDESGEPIAAAWMSVCNPFGCRSTNAGADGTFLLEGLEVITFGVRSHDDVESVPYRGTVVRLIRATVPDVVLDAGRLYVPTVQPAPLLAADADTPQIVKAGDGLELTVTRKALEFPLGPPTDRLSARRIPLEHVPPFDVGNEKLVAAWAITPYSTTSRTVPVAVKMELPLDPGTEVHLRSVWEFDGKLSDPVTAHASLDGKTVQTDPGAGLDNLTWILVSR